MSNETPAPLPDEEFGAMDRLQQELEERRKQHKPPPDPKPAGESIRPQPPRRWTDADLEQMEADRIKAERSRTWAKLVASRGKRYASCRFDNFETGGHNGLAIARDRVRDYAENLPDRVARGQNLVLFGPVGSGKDHLMFAALRAAVWFQVSARWTDGPALFGLFKSAMDDKRQTEDGVLANLVAPSILAVSDPAPPGAAVASSWEHKILYRLTDARYSNLAPLWVTVNAANRADLEEALGRQTADRLLHDALAVPVVAPSFRRA